MAGVRSRIGQRFLGEEYADTRLLAHIWSLWAISLAYGVTINRLVGFGCPFRACTGLDCPGCGGTRAAFSLLHGRLVDALHYNALAVTIGLLTIPIAVAVQLGGRLGFDIRQSVVWRNRVVVTVSLLATWTLFRNLPTFAWFSTTWASR